MGKLIIGIHGLANKPKAQALERAWRDAIAEGLRINNSYTEQFDFRMVYWADYLYKYPLHNDPGFEFDELFNDEPYYESGAGDLEPYKDGLIDEIRAGALDIAGIGLDGLKRHFGFDGLADRFLSKFLKDLAYYYDPKQLLRPRDGGAPDVARRVLQNDLRELLKASIDQEIMLISHSMGTIIAYDTLRDIGPGVDNSLAGSSVEHFVTIGSPLGLPHVRAKIREERNYASDDSRSMKADVRTPSIVSKTWKNFADKKDPVALDVHLEDDFGSNDRGVAVHDDLISNDYRKPSITTEAGALRIERDADGKKNHHKSYGYLRAPEVSSHIEKFLRSH